MNFELARHQMVEQQVRPFDVLDESVLAAMRTIRRERFVSDAWRDAAYADAGVPIGHGQRTFSPKIDGRVLQAVAVTPGDRVLEIGTGSGYLTACLAHMGGNVVSLERVGALADAARQRLDDAGIDDVDVRHAAAPDDLPDERFDVVVVGGAIARDSAQFEKRLQIDGRLFVVEGEAPAMSARLIRRAAEQRWYAEDLFETVLPYLEGYAPAPSFEF